jgi:glycosyltransferase involved in cell wall biosynthesis
VRVERQAPRGPAAARNRGLAMARGRACLFLGDDVWPGAGLIDRHLEFHRAHEDERWSLLGRVVPAAPLDASPFIRWLHEHGVQFSFAGLRAGEVPFECFWTANVSAKTELLRRVGGFDEEFRSAACEDAEIGARLARAGMRLCYEPAARAEHYHPTDLARTLSRMRAVGQAFRLLGARAPELPMPRHPGLRHRARALGLTALNIARLRPLGVRQATWRFLCDEAQREAYWNVTPADGRRLLIGDRLARIAIADAAAAGSSTSTPPRRPPR